MKVIVLLLMLYFNALALNFKLASYNSENLFDLKYNKTEYSEYIPNLKSKWNQKTLNIKISNITKVLNDMDADIVALQEIESLEVLKLLQNKNPKYKYIKFYKKNSTAVGLAFLSKFEIIDFDIIKIDRFDKYSRPALKVKFKIENKTLDIINTHWNSKRKAESSRIKYALAIYKYAKKLKNDYIILGDLNSNYNEFQTFKYNKKLNDSDGITGINQILNTTIDENFISKNDILSYKKRVHFNTWLELAKKERFSYKFRGKNNTPDNMIFSPFLFDNKNIEYINNSFGVFKPKYLYKNKKINRWKIKGKNRVHLGKGYSDHLPIFASFSTDNKKTIKKQMQKKIYKISNLYKLDTIKNKTSLKNIIVLYKYKNSAIIKQKNDRAIYLFKSAKHLKLGGIYDLKVSKLASFYGLKELKKVDSYKLKELINTQNFYLDGQKIDLFNKKYQNEIITNLSGVYKNGYLHFKNTKIKLYAKDKKILPKQGQNVTIRHAHLTLFKNKNQLTIYKKNDYKVSNK